MRERELHSAVVLFLGYALPVTAVLHHSPNEGKRGLQAQRDLKTSGVRTGWPDLEIIYQGRAYFLELKAPHKYPSAEQRAVHASLRAAGCEAVTCRSVAEVEMALSGWGIPLRARIAA